MPTPARFLYAKRQSESWRGITRYPHAEQP